MDRDGVCGGRGYAGGRRGRSSRSGGRSVHPHAQVGDDRQFDSGSRGNNVASFYNRRQTWVPKTPDSTSEKSGYQSTSTSYRGTPQQTNSSPESVTSKAQESKSLFDIHPNSKDPGSYTEPRSQYLDGNCAPNCGKKTGEWSGGLNESLSKVQISCLRDDSEMPLKIGTNHEHCKNGVPQYGKTSPVISEGKRNMEQSEDSAFDICLNEVGTHIILKPSLLALNREKKNESNRAAEGKKSLVLRPGMVLLKNYLSHADQVKIVKKCRDLGVGHGGFYQPGYHDGSKLHLKMMCLGKNWDPETSKYDDYRPTDKAKPPTIPDEFNQLVKRSIDDSQSIIRNHAKKSWVEDILPSMSPDICIVNFYSATGRLGLHKDRDESQENLQKGLPVVSFSIGDSADFLYGDENDVSKAEKIVLESGDVLIFGGKSRHIYHGVTAIHANPALKPLLEETNLRPGRLNLTFRQY